jgi:transketolase
MVGMAAGMAAVGKVPLVLMSGVAASLAASRALLMSVAHSSQHVVVAGMPGGLSAGHAGSTAQALGDLAVFGTLPGFRVLVPTDAEETAKALITLVDEPGPGYMRLSGEERPVITGPDSLFDMGRASLLREGDQLTIVACGALVYEALVAADLLEDQGIAARVLAVHTLDPIDGETIGQVAMETGALVVAEEHTALGGLGSRIAAVVAGSRPVPIEHLHAGAGFVGANGPEALRESLGLTAAAIVEAAGRALARKG